MADSDEMDVRMTALEEFVLRRIKILEETFEANSNQTRQHLNIIEGAIKCMEDFVEKEIDGLKNSHDLISEDVKYLKDVTVPQDITKISNQEESDSESEKRIPAHPDHHNVRRSGRHCMSVLKAKEERLLEDAILAGKEDDFEVIDTGDKGRGVLSTRAYRRGEFVIEYAGDLIDLTTAKERERKYSCSRRKYGCYMYYFQHNSKNYCIDATLESGKLGRLLNHSKKGNCHTKVIQINDRPYLILVASRDISPREELMYDYGDRRKSSLQWHPWLAA